MSHVVRCMSWIGDFHTGAGKIRHIAGAFKRGQQWQESPHEGRILVESLWERKKRSRPRGASCTNFCSQSKPTTTSRTVHSPPYVLYNQTNPPLIEVFSCDFSSIFSYAQGNAPSTDDPSLSPSLVDRVSSGHWKESAEGSGMIERPSATRGGHSWCLCRVSSAAISFTISCGDWGPYMRGLDHKWQGFESIEFPAERSGRSREEVENLMELSSVRAFAIHSSFPYPAMPVCLVPAFFLFH